MSYIYDDRNLIVQARLDPARSKKVLGVEMYVSAPPKGEGYERTKQAVLIRRSLATVAKAPRAAAKGEKRKWAWAIILGLALIGGLIYWSFIVLEGELALVKLLLIVVAVVTLPLIIAMAIAKPKQPVYKDARERIKALPFHCASCWAPMHGPEYPDGCCVCTNCGAAWRSRGASIEELNSDHQASTATT